MMNENIENYILYVKYKREKAADNVRNRRKSIETRIEQIKVDWKLVSAMKVYMDNLFFSYQDADRVVYSWEEETPVIRDILFLRSYYLLPDAYNCVVYFMHFHVDSNERQYYQPIATVTYISNLWC